MLNLNLFNTNSPSTKFFTESPKKYFHKLKPNISILRFTKTGLKLAPENVA